MSKEVDDYLLPEPMVAQLSLKLLPALGMGLLLKFSRILIAFACDENSTKPYPEIRN